MKIIGFTRRKLRKFIYYCFALTTLILIFHLYQWNVKFKKSISSITIKDDNKAIISFYEENFGNICLYLNKTTELKLWYNGYYNLNNERELELMKHVQFVYDQTCNENTEFLMAVISAGNNFERRKTIRNTFGRKRNQYEYNFDNNSSHPNISHCYIFVTGYNDDKKLNTQIDEEFKEYKDILRIPTHDTYEKLPLKIMLTFHLLNKIDGKFTFISKVDDDVFIRTKYLIPYIYNLDPNITTFGLLQRCSPVLREPWYKWYLAYEEYPYDCYPDYLKGLFYIIRRKIVPQIISTEFKIPFFPFEDVYLGMIFQELKIELPYLKNFEYCTNQNCFSTERYWIFMPGGDSEFKKVIKLFEMEN